MRLIRNGMIGVSETNKYFLRNIIGSHMDNMGYKNSLVVAVTADLAGTCRIKDFFKNFPERSFNTGIAEQNMVSFASGLAHEGYLPYVFSMSPFISMRACEQCRTDIAYGNLNVKLIGVYSGFSGGISGATHWGLEDSAIMSSISGFTVLEPSDPVQAIKMMDETLSYKGPVYIRVSVEPTFKIYNADNYEYKIGKASIPLNGEDGAFICSGIVVQKAIRAAEKIYRDYGKKIKVVDMHTIKPIDEDAIISAVNTGAVVVAQDHNIIGGLGYHVAAVMVKRCVYSKLIMLGAPDKFIPMAHADYLYKKYGYDSDGLYSSMVTLLKGQ